MLAAMSRGTDPQTYIDAHPMEVALASARGKFRAGHPVPLSVRIAEGAEGAWNTTKEGVSTAWNLNIALARLTTKVADAVAWAVENPYMSGSVAAVFVLGPPLLSRR